MQRVRDEIARMRIRFDAHQPERGDGRLRDSAYAPVGVSATD